MQGLTDIKFPLSAGEVLYTMHRLCATDPSIHLQYANWPKRISLTNLMPSMTWSAIKKNRVLRSFIYDKKIRIHAKKLINLLIRNILYPLIMEVTKMMHFIVVA